MKLLLCLSGILCINLSFTVASPEAFEVSESLFSELPGGKEADGIVGDFILRNDLVEAVIAQNAPFRKAIWVLFGVLMVRLKVVFMISH